MTSNYAPFLHNVDAPDHGRALRVTETTVAGEVSIAAGRYRIDQTVTNRPAATLFPPAPPLGNGVNWIYINSAGAIATTIGGPFPANSIPLAQVTVAVGVIVPPIVDCRCFFYEDTAAGGGGGYDTIEEEGGALPQRTVIDFQGAGVTAADVGGKTRITIPGGGVGPIGPIGPPGIDGLDGLDGEPGQPGAAGSAGAAGVAGPMGPPGIDGEDGEDAYPIPGPVGKQGTTGGLGPPGWDGEDGETLILAPSLKPPRYIVLRALDAATSHTVLGTVGGDFSCPVAGAFLDVGAYVDTAGATGTATIDIHKNGTTILSTKITLDDGEKTSRTAAAAPVLDPATNALAIGDILTVDISVLQTTAAKGLSVWLNVREA